MKCLKIYFILFLIPYQVQSRINVKLINLQCQSLDQKLGDFEKCALKAVNRDVTEMSAHFKLLKRVHNASVILKLIKRGDVRKKPIYQYNVNICEFFRNKRRNPLAQMFYNIFGFEKFSNMNHTCPYNHDLILDRCRLDTKLLNLLSIRQGEYTITTIWFVNHRLSVRVNCSVRVS